MVVGSMHIVPIIFIQCVIAALSIQATAVNLESGVSMHFHYIITG